MKVKITKFDHFGRGIGQVDKKIVFVSKALPNETVDIKITNNKKNYMEGQVQEIIIKDVNRINAICPYYNTCGGCSFLHTNYGVEKEFKINKAKELLGQCDKFYETTNLNYRNKVTLHIKDNDMGFYEEKTNKIINIDYCYLLDDNLNRVIKNLKKFDLSKYQFQKIIIKTHQNKILMDVDNYVDDDFIHRFHDVDTIIANNKIVKGSGYIEEVIDNKIFKITPEAFFQVNKIGLENIYQVIKDFIKDKSINRVLDLYSGTALWGILISKYTKEIISIEINKEAISCAKDNVKKNNINNIRLINGDVKDYLNQFNNIDLVIVDPPRSGLSKQSMEHLRKINSKYFIYISCDMQTLRRDLCHLKEQYNVISINLIDMFRGTYHCESIVIMERK